MLVNNEKFAGNSSAVIYKPDNCTAFEELRSDEAAFRKRNGDVDPIFPYYANVSTNFWIFFLFIFCVQFITWLDQIITLFPGCRGSAL